MANIDLQEKPDTVDWSYTFSHNSNKIKGLPKVGSIEEEQAHHQAIQNKHKSDIEVGRVTQTWEREIERMIEEWMNETV